MQAITPSHPIKAIIGLGNPGRQYFYNRHNIGFLIVDALADRHGGSWKIREHMEIAEIQLNGLKIILIKPLTFMNNSGKVIPYLTKQGINAENILVVHDELELPMGQIKLKMGGSHKGHNGLRSIIGVCGDAFMRVRFGIGRPVHKDDVPNYVLQNFKENKDELDGLIASACDMIETLIGA
jgi:peptidyl-tRNA hydrolase, PTH1 family